ncbi:class I SAM-dependent methyltransferase [Roseicyclus mahoneyensis]|uniref:Phosphatidylethanolamine/phosphatidyl-N-methylethanolamine N-methyltransferase n=1 Tax=Roseicyclus mahoneyensis TaxID=164332 RepID=A0A316H4F0_9RHOB|nr:methyltransferase domain-containing protein [Roseicyclus mahoneyensis]PWK62443.1 phosphatidylethanolamine/phosphatidyl-N-methylethanolamine N-methyltransferase [Roseicyclus mahoneyensis]
MASSDFSLFMGQLLRRPHQVVALAPSSRFLCAEMVARIDPAAGPVIELGAGTGNITQAILDRGVAQEDLHSIEMNPEFCDRLRARFPRLNVHQMSAGEVGSLAVNDAQAVVSGLPLLSMPLGLQRDILTGTFQRVRPGGSYVQFTYGPKPPVARAVREELDLQWTVSHKIWWNMPPARVYRFTRTAH